MSAVIGASHVLCSIGSGTDQVWAAVRAGIGRIVDSHVVDRHFEPVQMGLVPEEALSELDADVKKLPLPSRARRILRLAAPSFHAVAKDLRTAVPVLIGLPEVTHDEARWLIHVPAYLQKLTGLAIAREQSAVLPYGRAAALVALERGLELLSTGAVPAVVVGGVDSYLDLRLLGTLDAEQRILGPHVMDGFVPGEGAAFFVLFANSNKAHDHRSRVLVNAAASALDQAHRYGDAPARGEGLTAALTQVRQRMEPPAAPIETTFAGFNGESFDAKSWGVARLRHNSLFSPQMVIEHPADKFGDTGAAMGAILIALATRSLTSGARRGPALVWAASDRESRACAVVSLAQH